jgi:hypothetical protein
MQPLSAVRPITINFTWNEFVFTRSDPFRLFGLGASAEVLGELVSGIYTHSHRSLSERSELLTTYIP